MKLWSMVVAFALALSFVGVAGAAEGKKKEKKAETTLQGTVASVDASGNVKVTKKVAKKDAGGAAEEVTIATDAKTVVTIDGKAGKVSDLVAGMQVRVTPTTGKAEKIEARSAGKKGGGKGAAAQDPQKKAQRQAARQARKQAK